MKGRQTKIPLLHMCCNKMRAKVKTLIHHDLLRRSRPFHVVLLSDFDEKVWAGARYAAETVAPNEPGARRSQQHSGLGFFWVVCLCVCLCVGFFLISRGDASTGKS